MAYDKVILSWAVLYNGHIFIKWRFNMSVFPFERFPVEHVNQQSWLTGMGRFGHSRANGRKHGGCDIYTNEGEVVYPVAQGKVLFINKDFVKGLCGTPTQAILIEHKVNNQVFSVRYCEILVDSSLRVGSIVNINKAIGKVTAVCRQRDNSPLPMLHLEAYSPTIGSNVNPTLKSNPPYQRHANLIDPTSSIVASYAIHFGKKYDNVAKQKDYFV